MNSARWTAVALTICAVFILVAIGGTMEYQRAERLHAERMKNIELEWGTPLPTRNPKRANVQRQ